MAATMDAIAQALADIGISRAYGWPLRSVSPPAAVVAFPEEIRYDRTKSRGTDSTMFPVFLVVGTVVDKAARDALSGYLDPESSLSVKTALDGTLDGTVSNAHVSAARPQFVDIGEVQYLAATFDVTVTT